MAGSSPFLQGIQVGANLYANAKQLQERRQSNMLQAQQLMQQIQASRALQQYHDEQLKIQQAEEERRSAIAKRSAQFGPFVQNRFNELRSQSPLGLEPGATPEQLAPLQRQAVEEGVIQYGDPTDVVSMYRSQDSQQAANERALMTDSRIRELASEREKSSEDRQNQTFENAKALWTFKQETANKSSGLQTMNGREVYVSPSGGFHFLDSLSPQETAEVKGIQMQYSELIKLAPNEAKVREIGDELKQTMKSFFSGQKVKKSQSSSGGTSGITGRFTADGKYVPSK